MPDLGKGEETGAAPAFGPGTEPLLALDGLTHAYRARGRRRRPTAPAVRDASLEVRTGEIVAVVGESGSGKSTLARMVVGLLAPDRGGIAFRGEPLAVHRSHPQRRAIQMVFQDPKSSLNPRMSVERILYEVWQTHPEAVPPEGRAEGVRRLLGRVGLDPSLAAKRADEMSGGQAQRVSIARALAAGPDLLVCDEAVSALDVSVQTQIIALLLELRDSLGLSLLFITHDLGVVRQIADHVVVMRAGEVVERGPAEAVFTAPAEPYTRELLGAALELDLGAPA
jgi:ABC-type glutathione transport system ATPase component